ncbi:hypothetical protein [Streptomyces sp. HB132]|uniref:hypothetical protein n=1 Tax=Streptomyces sp. HB132 TaxID=767388 RepID=UPI00195FDEAC|nr:hypothetical protein [Streptomyces sp. HB132]MBM7437187.1 hypothetical protein [Streptomyces sp. HB132]
MARFDHTVTVTPLDRAWFEECARFALDTSESTRTRRGGDIVLGDGGPLVPGIRLLKGRHLRAGARYEIASDADEEAGTPGVSPVHDPVVMTVREWRRSNAIAVELRMDSADLAVRLAGRLRTPDRPGTLDVGFDVRSPVGGSLHRASGRARLDLAAWWAAAAARAGSLPPARAPLTARAKHRLGRARLTITPRPADDGSWEVGVTLTVRGRSLLRPVAALALLFGRVPLRRAFRSGVDQAAAGWNEALASAPLPDPDELRAELVKALTD